MEGRKGGKCSKGKEILLFHCRRNELEFAILRAVRSK